MIRKTLILLTTLGGAGLGSQLPEYAQQYQQRLGGAIDELQIIVNEFDADATEVGISREQALLTLSGSAHDFVRLRGDSMQSTIDRLDMLEQQQALFAGMLPAIRPTALLSYYDETLLRGTADDFVPAIPLSSAGLLWGGTGATAGWLGALLLALPFGGKSRKRRRRATSRIKAPANDASRSARALRNQRKSPRI